MYENMK